MNFQPITLIHRVSTNYYHSAGCDGMVALLVVVLSILSLVFIYQLSHPMRRSWLKCTSWF